MLKRFNRWLARQATKANLLFLGGALGVVHETLIAHAERPTLLILFAAMMGLPAFLTSTEVFPRDDDKDKHEDEKDDLDSD